ncbi:vacuolar ATP synthase subunit H, putative [Theileria equi strain WA]|uniref:V-type proton ATPase subunit H n=1 Tax=Theileria equi strain WA TaxID=1537102 RepID=L1L9C4_THEEQ|nr:vacuolar ATP synthase subunit H, putative [Theileria equi strain WA]EKX72012.1 vacuolar ATP synthase subunit H, putative [Theileria equi strain WA]|eukprot:XP_004831464.1 vacuolar ATP synthase subunit H, putative [Theileria equi strain WA]
MEPEALNKLMLKGKISYDFVTPDYEEWINSGALDLQSVEILKHFMTLNTIQKCEFIKNDDFISKIFLNATYASGPGLLRSFSLEHLCDVCRVDNSIYTILLDILHDRDVFEIYYDIATHEHDKRIVEKTLFLLSGFIAYGGSRFTDEQTQSLVKVINKVSIDSSAKLYAIANILELDKYRKLIENGTVANLLKSSLDKEANPNAQYKAVYCIWLISRSEEYVELLYKIGIVHALCALFSSTKVEKVVRVCLLLFKNLFQSWNCIEVMFDMNIAQTLTLLEYDKWRDEELYDTIHKLHAQLEAKTSKLSNFERYCSELNTGTLRWSVLHSEKFWAAHFEKFEQDEFSNITKLVDLLYKSTDPTTISIACFDLGEFARLYHNGKKICKKLKVKDKVMELIGNKDREVAREAMLCAQKLMVQHWQQVSAIQT